MKKWIVAICVKSDWKFKFFIRIRKKNSANSKTVPSIEWLDFFLQHKIQSVRFDSLGAWLSLQLIDQLRLIHCIDHIVVFSLSQIIVFFYDKTPSNQSSVCFSTTNYWIRAFKQLLIVIIISTLIIISFEFMLVLLRFYVKCTIFRFHCGFPSLALCLSVLCRFSVHLLRGCSISNVTFSRSVSVRKPF